MANLFVLKERQVKLPTQLFNKREIKRFDSNGVAADQKINEVKSLFFGLLLSRRDPSRIRVGSRKNYLEVEMKKFGSLLVALLLLLTFSSCTTSSAALVVVEEALVPTEECVPALESATKVEDLVVGKGEVEVESNVVEVIVYEPTSFTVGELGGCECVIIQWKGDCSPNPDADAWPPGVKMFGTTCVVPEQAKGCAFCTNCAQISYGRPCTPTQQMTR